MLSMIHSSAFQFPLDKKNEKWDTDHFSFLIVIYAKNYFDSVSLLSVFASLAFLVFS